MNVFVETDYREVLKTLVAERKKIDPDFSFQALAEKMGVQKSYLSKVTRGSADLSGDQLYLATEALGLNAEQRQYLALLLEHERSAVKKRKDALWVEVKKMQARHHHDSRDHYPGKRQAPDSDRLAEYYLEPLLCVVHMAMFCPKYRNDPGALAEALQLKPFRVSAAIHKLEQLGLLRREKNRIVPLEPDLHIVPGTPVYSSWRNSMRALSLHHLRYVTRETAYSYTLAFPANIRTRTTIHRLLLETVKRAQELIKESPQDEVFQLNIDFFNWTQD